MAKKKKKKKVVKKTRTPAKKALKIMIGKVDTGNPYMNEWMMYDMTSGKATNLVRVVVPIVETVISVDDTPVKTKQGLAPEFICDDFFTDFNFTVNASKFTYTRQLEVGENLYNQFIAVINQRREMQAKAAAQLKVQQEQAEAAKTAPQGNVTNLPQPAGPELVQ